MGKKDLTNKCFGRLTVLRRSQLDKKWTCRCECGNIIDAFGQNLERGRTRSCGCYNQEIRLIKSITHGMSDYPEYGIWNGIKNRCLNPKVKAYPDYGGRGITICDHWKNDFPAFYADMGPRPSPQHSIDRINVNGNYEPENCQWVLYNEQARNKRFRGNKSGVRGVYGNHNKWAARIRVDDRLINLGTFSTIQEAKKARLEGEKKYFGRYL